MVGGIFTFVIFNFVCDIPARCFIKQSKLYSGYQGCDQCTQEGTYDGRTTYPGIGCPARSDDTFRERVFPAHHTGDSPLEKLDIDLIKHFPIDYMHLCLSGCTKICC